MAGRFFTSSAMSESCSIVSDSLRPMDYSPWNSPGQNTGVGSHSFLQGIFPNPGIESRSPALQVDSLPSEVSLCESAFASLWYCNSKHLKTIATENLQCFHFTPTAPVITTLEPCFALILSCRKANCLTKTNHMYVYSICVSDSCHIIPSSPLAIEVQK